MTAQKKSALLVVRIGGLSSDVLTRFSSQLGKQVDLLTNLEAELKIARMHLVNCLYEAIHDAPAEKRHALLSVKRDSYNDRPLARHAQGAAWCYIKEVAEAPAHRVLELEQRIATLKEQFNMLFNEEIIRQQEHLAGLLDNPLLVSGLAIASPSVARESHRLRSATPGNFDHRARRLTATLLRYVSRAALKLSPFATFTTIGLAELEEGIASPALIGKQWQRRSLVRLRRNLLNRCSDLLEDYAPWREKLAVEINDSVSSLPDGRVLYRRSPRYLPNEEEKVLGFRQESLVRVHLRGPFIECVKSLLASQTLRYGELKSAIAVKLGLSDSDESVNAQLDRLIDIGFLRFILPWNLDDGHLEKAILQEFRKLPDDPVLETFLQCLQQLVEIEDGFLTANNHLAAFQELDDLTTHLLKSAAALSHLSHIDVTSRVSEHEIYQDVWCSPVSGDEREILRLGRNPLDQALRSMEPVVRLTQLYNHRFDFLLTLGSFLRQHSGGKHQFSPLEVFDCAQALWRDYLKFELNNRNVLRGWENTWNPFAIPMLKDLAQSRKSISGNIKSCFIHDSNGQRMNLDLFNALLKPLPDEFIKGYKEICLFLQPASQDGSLWMLNRIKEGTGRFASRYTPVMPEGLKAYYTTALSCRGNLELDGKSAQLLDLYCTVGDTINVHAPQTPRLLVLDGEQVNTSVSRRCTLKDLVIIVDSDGWPQLYDRQNVQCCPVYLGIGYHDYLPTIVKFLCTFGPTEMAAIFPPPWTEQKDSVTVQHRTVIGNVVVHRKSWHVPLSELRSNLSSCDIQSYIAVHRWRQKYAIPERVFAIERVDHPISGSRSQPQYLDFDSPLFLPILRSLTAGPDQGLTLVEMLPSPDLFLRDANGQAWAVELLVDSLAMKPANHC
jgi:hypothetical protein